MAVRFDASTDKLSRTASGLGSAFTVAGWFYLDTDRNTYSTFWSIDNGSGYNSLITQTDGQTLYWASTGGGDLTSHLMTIGGWYFIACSFLGTASTDTLYYAPAGTAALTSLAGDMSPGNDAWTFYIGGSGFATEWLDGRAAHVKVWSAALTQAEVELERWSATPKRTADLWAWYPLADSSDINDHSANGRNLTTAGSLTTVADPSLNVSYTKILDQRVVANGATSGSGDYTSSSFTTQAGSVLVAVIGVGINGNSSTMEYDLPRPVTSGLTWVPRCRRFTTGNFSTVSEIWVADNASAGSKTIAQSSGATWDTSIKTIDVVVLELVGAAAAALQGNPFVIGGRIYGAGTDPGAQSLTLPVAPESTSLVVASTTSFVYSTTAFSVTPGADMTEVADHANGSGDTNQFVFQAQVRAGSTSQTVAWQDIQAGGSGAESYAWSLVAAEFKQVGSTPNSQAVRFNGSTSWYRRNAYGFPASTDFSLTFWLKLGTDRNTYSTAVAFGDAGSNYAHFGFGSVGDLLSRDTTAGGANTGYSPPIGRWVFFAHAFTVAGPNGFLYWTDNELQQVSGYGQSTPWNWMTTALDFLIGNDTYNGYFDGSVAAVKIWSAALTYTELQAEQFSSAPVRTANFFAWYPFNAGPSTADAFGSRTLTQNGTPTLDTYGPPIVYVPMYVPGPPSGLFTDNFNRADTTTGILGGTGLNSAAASDWSGDGWQIASNKALRTGAGSDYVTFATTLGSPDHYAEVDYDTGGTTYCVVNIRRPSATNVETGYLGYIDPGGGAAHIAKTVASSFSSISGGDFTAGAPYPSTGRIRLEALGTLLTLKINGATIGSVNDSTITTGNYAGMNASSLGLMDNFAVGSSVPAIPTMFLTPTRSTVTLI